MRGAPDVRPRTFSRHRLQKELHELRARLADAEATLAAIGKNEVDALVVLRSEHDTEQVLTIDGAHLPWYHFVEHMRDGALTVAGDGTILHANRRMALMAGREQPPMGQPLATMFDEPVVARVLSPGGGGDPLALRTALKRSDGTRTPVELSASVLPLPGVRRIGIVVSETTAPADGLAGPTEVGARAAARVSWGDLEAALAHVPIGIIAVNARTGRVSYANKRAEEIIGKPIVGLEREITHVELTSFRLDGTVVEPDLLPVARVLAGEPLVREELARVRGDGSIVQIRSTAVPVHDAEGRIASVVLTIEDMSEEARARADREANERFRELFIGMLGHDLRDPLTTIVTGSHLLKKRLDARVDARLLQRLDASAARMTRMVDQMLDFARARLGGGIPIVRGRVDLPALVQAAVSDALAAHPDRHVETVVSGAGVGDWDADRLAQVVSNLLGNALEHGDPSRPVRVTVRDECRWVRLAVHNEGGPIPPELLPVIFDPFQRAGAAGAAGARKARGVGLGLYIAEQIVRGHGGSLTVVSTREDGTTFTVSLPRGG